MYFKIEFISDLNFIVFNRLLNYSDFIKSKLAKGKYHFKFIVFAVFPHFIHQSVFLNLDLA
jgi:hypothetical protein